MIRYQHPFELQLAMVDLSRRLPLTASVAQCNERPHSVLLEFSLYALVQIMPSDTATFFSQLLQSSDRPKLHFCNLLFHFEWFV